MSKCDGCGATLQSTDINKEGYIDESLIDKYTLCKRCFRLKNYGEQDIKEKINIDYAKTLKIIEKESLILHFVDIFNIYSLKALEGLENNIILVIAKRDVLPKSISNKKLLDNIRKRFPNYSDYIIISSKKNYNFDLLYKMVDKYKQNNEVYIIGDSNSGKSTFINKFTKNYNKDEESKIVTGFLSGTTIDIIKIKINKDLYLIDTPGFISDSTIFNYVDLKTAKKIVPKNEIKPRIFQTKEKCSFSIEDICKINYCEEKPNNFSFYISNNIKIIRKKHCELIDDNLKVVSIELGYNDDLVIEGLCILRTSIPCKLTVQIYEGVEVYKKEKLF